MQTSRYPVVLAIVDPGLRSVLTALLGMAGEAPISTTDHLDPTLGENMRATAMLIIQGVMIGAAPTEWGETLRNQCWLGSIVIIAEQPLADVQPEDGVTLVHRRSASTGVVDAVQRWHSKNQSSANRLG